MSLKKRMKWNFPGNKLKGEFYVKDANRINRLYFPLFNMQGFMSAITPELKGDIKTGQNTFLLEPQVSENILQTKNSRNFWIKTDNNIVWSVPGVSAEELAKKAKNKNSGNTNVVASPGAFRIERENKLLKIKASIEVFVPDNAPLEISIITLENTGNTPLHITATGAIPLYGRSADNLRDHRQVTTLLNKIEKNNQGIVLTPTMSFDERGHKTGDVSYSAHGFSDNDKALSGIVADLETFIGEGGSLEAPEMIYSNKDFKDHNFIDGRQTIAALQFDKVTILPEESTSFSIILGIHKKEDNINNTLTPYNSVDKSVRALKDTKDFWQKQTHRLTLKTNDPVFDNWFLWVSLQPVMRRVFGCSFLPDFGYGRGGRGWRDLWQDCLGILLTNPLEAKEILLNNIQGVRIDGSNATIIGNTPGEFIADRNNIPRTWMDHGVWPLLTIALYIEQTGDLDILLEKRPFFSDRFSHRSKQINPDWDENTGTKLKFENNEIFEAPIIMHLLIENLTQFYNRGENGNIKLEDADWNDGMDMAHNKGESVPFSAAYAENLSLLAKYMLKLDEQKITTIELPVELKELISNKKTSKELNNPKYLNEVLQNYFNKVSGKLCSQMEIFNIKDIAHDLINKSTILKTHIRKNEFLNTGKNKYFNGYYNNDGKKVEGLIQGKEQMTLTGQVFPIMSEVATISQCKASYKATRTLLKDKELKGYRLNTDFKKPMLNLGRAFSFSYGDKENGGFFSHMNIMFANALYKRGLVKEGFEVLNSIFLMSKTTDKSMMFPCIPEYFNSFGRGLYCYITGSASWMVLTMVTQVFGIKGQFGKLCFEPKLVKKQFNNDNLVFIETIFKGKKITVKYKNTKNLEYGKYHIKNIILNGANIDFLVQKDKAILNNAIFNNNQENFEFEVILG